MKKVALAIMATLAAPAALAADGGSFTFNQAYTDTVEAGVDVRVDDIRFGVWKDDNASRFRIEGYAGYKFNDHVTSVLKYRESDNPEKEDDTRWRSETSFTKLGLPEWLLRDIRVRVDYFSEYKDTLNSLGKSTPSNTLRGELRLRNRVRYNNLTWVADPEFTDINHEDGDGARWNVIFGQELHYKINDVTVSYLFEPRYTVRGDGGWNRIRHAFEVQKRFSNEWRLRAGLRKESTRNIHNGDHDWNEDFQYRLAADYRF